jgi:hypothetical protein
VQFTHYNIFLRAAIYYGNISNECLTICKLLQCKKKKKIGSTYQHGVNYNKGRYSLIGRQIFVSPLFVVLIILLFFFFTDLGNWYLVVRVFDWNTWLQNWITKLNIIKFLFRLLYFFVKLFND